MVALSASGMVRPARSADQGRWRRAGFRVLAGGVAAVIAATPALVGHAGQAGAATLYLGGTCVCNATPPAAEIEGLSGGYLTDDPVRVGLKYPAGILFAPSINAGVAALEAEMAQHAGPMRAAGTSQGALVLNVEKKRLMALPEDQRPAPDQLSFVTFGDPSASQHGIFTQLPVLRVALAPNTTATPVDTPYDTVEFVREYDTFADWPDRPLPLAVLNSAAALSSVHPYYNGADPTVPGTRITVTENSLGGTNTHILVPTANLPLTQPLRDLGVPDEKVDRLDRTLRRRIDRAYDRPTPTTVVGADQPGTTKQSGLKATFPSRSALRRTSGIGLGGLRQARDLRRTEVRTRDRLARWR